VKPTVIAFYLPQFHPIPENDEWWGPGFTEWTNVVRGEPLFPGHYQPRLPRDLGFYDLRVPEVRQQQAALASAHGIDGFCYYHYWFDGRRVLERPFDEVLASGEPDLPFALCWANENWTRRWDGRSQDVLIQQKYSPDDDDRHFDALLPAFTDERYIRIDGRPLFLVYRASKLPAVRRTTDAWRSRAVEAGLSGLYLCRVNSFPEEEKADPTAQGFDAAIEWVPWWTSAPRVDPLSHFRRLGRLINAKRSGVRIYRYADIVEARLTESKLGYELHPCVVPGWDNTVRRRRDGVVFHDSTPELYRYWLERSLERASARNTHPLVFICAWNEWAEGCHLEPCMRWNRAYLEATATATAADGFRAAL